MTKTCYKKGCTCHKKEDLSDFVGHIREKQAEISDMLTVVQQSIAKENEKIIVLGDVDAFLKNMLSYQEGDSYIVVPPKSRREEARTLYANFKFASRNAPDEFLAVESLRKHIADALEEYHQATSEDVIRFYNKKNE